MRPPNVTDARTVKTICNIAHVEHAGQLQNVLQTECDRAVVTLLMKGISIRRLSRLTGISKGIIEGTEKKRQKRIEDKRTNPVSSD